MWGVESQGQEVIVDRSVNTRGEKHVHELEKIHKLIIIWKLRCPECGG